MKRLSAQAWLIIGLVLAVAGLVVAQFMVPSKADRLAAAGDLKKLSPVLARTFADGGEFLPKKKPQPGDWLAQHKEPGQTYVQYLRSRPNVPNKNRSVIYVLPLGTFDDKSPPLELLKSYTEAYYHPMRVKMLPAVPANQVKARSRINGQKQWNSVDILRWMPSRLPKDAYAMIAVTMTDLYPKDSWNFVFGQASLRNRVGVFSFARYDPRFWGDEWTEKSKVIMLRRAAKVLTHETGHMFGVAHCIHYECNMGGSNSLPETDATPLHLCPVCLRKMHYAVAFDPVRRYEALLSFYEKQELDEEAGWVKNRLGALQAAQKKAARE